MRKYRNVPTEVDGIEFDSKREAHRYGELKLLLRAGEIRGLKCHTDWPLIVNGLKVCTYEDDFQYEELTRTSVNGKPPFDVWRLVVEDVKGVKTAVYRLKKALMRAVHKVEIREVQ